MGSGIAVKAFVTAIRINPAAVTLLSPPILALCYMDSVARKVADKPPCILGRFWMGGICPSYSYYKYHGIGRFYESVRHEQSVIDYTTQNTHLFLDSFRHNGQLT